MNLTDGALGRLFSRHETLTLPLERHAAKVSRVADQLRQRHSARPLSILKSGASHHVPKRNDARRQDDKVDVSDLQEILEIDVGGKTCTAEPGVTFADLVEATLKHGLIPIVVPELRTITVGGAVSGCSLESMSFKYGGFHDTCFEYEILTANGDVITATPENEHRLVFQMIHGSFGTLGVLTKLRFSLIDAKPYVRLEHEHHRTFADYKAAIEGHFHARDIDFMDGIIHAKDHFVLCTGRFADKAPYTNRYDWTKIYYRSTADRREDYLETEQYVFRYDRGVTNVHPKSFLGRLLLGKFLDSSRLLKLAEKVPQVLSKKPDVTVDLFIPFSRAEEFLDWYEAKLPFVPLWVVPYKRVRDYEWVNPRFFESMRDELFLDIAIYGMKQPEGRNIYREIEEELKVVNGIKTLISHNFYGEEEFWTIFNRDNFNAVKKITDPNNIFRDLWEKTCKAMQGK